MMSALGAALGSAEEALGSEDEAFAELLRWIGTTISLLEAEEQAM